MILHKIPDAKDDTCIIPGCARPIKVQSSGLCHAHDMQRRRTGSTETTPRGGICSVDGCGERVRARGLCHRHDEQQRRTGDPIARKKPRKAHE